MLQAQGTNVNTLDNWGHKTHTQSKQIKDDRGKIRLKGHGPKHTMHLVTSVLVIICQQQTTEFPFSGLIKY